MDIKTRTIRLVTPKLSPNSQEVVQKRYLRLDKSGKPQETPAEMFYRVANFMAQADKNYIKTSRFSRRGDRGSKSNFSTSPVPTSRDEDSRQSRNSKPKETEKQIAKTTEKFYKILASLKFLPGGRILFEAGSSHIGQFASCFVVPVPDSIQGIFESLTNAAVIQQHNGGTGFNFSHIRPKGDDVRGVPNVAAGPIHYIKTFDTGLSRVLQGSKRHGANMGILNIDHPDIEEFIDLKDKGSQLKNFNISVGVTDDFMEKVREDKDYDLINPRTGESVKKLRAKTIFNRIIEKAWACADPGVIFLDKLTRENPTPNLGKIEATNPCGEQPLLPYESCNLGSIVLPNHVKKRELDWQELKKTVHAVIHFMDNMIDLNNYPLPEIRENVLKTRKIGLGIMGFAQMLYKLGIPYNSNDAVTLAEKIMKFIREEGRVASCELAKTRGVFPAWRGSIYEKKKLKLRNATITTIAPNGTISMVANTSSGVEPVFSLVTLRRTFFEAGSENKSSREMIFIDSVFEELAKKNGFYSEKLMKKIYEEGSIKNLDEIPEKIRKIFVTAHDIKPEWHVKIQAAAQKYTDNAVSKTINFPYSATASDVRKAYILAYELGCKGVTIYRDGSKQDQVLSIGKKEHDVMHEAREFVDDVKGNGMISKNAQMVLEKRALLKSEDGEIQESPDQLFRRVAKIIAQADKRYPVYRRKIKQTENEFYEAMKNMEFLSGQAIRNVGSKKLTLSACFVLPISDSIDGIMKTMSENVIVHKATGGTGINFSALRSRNAQVGSTRELAAGPVSFMRAFNATQDTLKTKGGRKQGSMVILNVGHPDIEEFIQAKDRPGELSNFNISVGIFNDFMEAVEKDKDYELVDPHNKKVIKKIKAAKLFDMIVDHAWQTADPGVLFLDRIERDNPTPHLGKLETTNPCGEQPLLPYETCNLGSIISSNMIKYEGKKAEIDFDKLRKIVRLGVHFLDNTIDLNVFPLDAMEKMTKQNRKIGLGVMGFADMLIKLGIPYNSDKAVETAQNLMKFISAEAHQYSEDLGKKKGVFPNFKKSAWKKRGFGAMRNAAITTIAPTGYISIVAGCTSGIEPIFAIAYKRKNSLGGVEQFEVHPLFEKIARKKGIWSQELLEKIFKVGSIQKFAEIPNDVKKIFVTAHDILPEWHLKIQAAFQKYTDNAVSKTINFPENASRADIAKTYKLAYKLGCKGVTIYRYGSKDAQVLTKGEEKKSVISESKFQALSKPRPRPEVVRGKTYELKTAYGGLYVVVNDDKEGKPFEVFATIGKSGGFFAAESEAICRMISLALRSGIPASQVIKQLKGIRGPMPSWSKKGTIFSIPDAIAKILEEHIKKDQVQLPFDLAEKKAPAPEGKIATAEIVRQAKVLENGKTSAAETLKNTDKEDGNGQVKIQQPKLDLTKLVAQVVKKETEKEKVKVPVLSVADIGHAPECPECGSMLEFGEGCLICRGCGYSKCG